MRKKVTIVGAGNVGATLAQRAHDAQLADVVLIDIPETGGMPRGKALDIEQSGSVGRCDFTLTGSTDYAASRDSDVAVITAGLPRKPGMTREDLLATNAKIVSGAARQIAAGSPSAVLIVVTNPLDAMCYAALKASGFGRERVLGMAGVLDGSRMERLMARKLGVSIENVFACVLGTHGETMVPVARYSTVFGVPLPELLPERDVAEITAGVVAGGAEIVELLKTGSAYYAPSASILEMVRAILLDKHKILPVSVWLQGEYGLSDVYLGVPAVLGEKGLDRVFEIPLAPAEKAGLAKAAAAIKEMIAQLQKTPVPA